MKTYIATTLLIAFTTTALAGVETNSTYLKIVQASNDIQNVISALPDVEKLWPQDPDTYLKTVNQAVHVLSGSQNNPDAKQALLNLFESMMQKPCPTNEDQIGSWVSQKTETALFCFNFSEFQNDKSRWLDIAKFTGEVRSKIIPNYKPKGVLLNGIGTTPEEIAQNDKNVAEDELQAALWQADRMLTFSLLHRFPSSNPTNADFTQQISDAAHLTPEEHSKLNFIRQP